MKNILLNATTQYATVGMTMLFVQEMKQTLFELRWMELAVILLILIDFVYGVAASVAIRREAFHFSRAGRRTVCKFIEYNAYLAFGFVMGMAILTPLNVCNPHVSAACGLLLAILFESDSIVEHFCDVHGIKRRISVKKLLVSYLQKRFSGVGEALNVLEQTSEKREEDKR
mgnify:CR=1 FL=1|jgi:hypothetical protein